MQMLGVSWDDSKKPSLAVTLTAALLAAALVTGPLATDRADAAPQPSSKPVEVIVREAQGSGSAAEHAVRAAGGTITRRLGIINGFSARIPASAVPEVASAFGVSSVTPNGRVEMTDYHDADNSGSGSGDRGTLYRTA